MHKFSTSTAVAQGSAYLTSGGTKQSVGDCSPLYRVYGELEQGLTELGQRIETLESRLAPVLAAPFPMAGSVGESDAPGSPFVENIRSDTRRVRSLIDTVSQLIDRVEV